MAFLNSNIKRALDRIDRTHRFLAKSYRKRNLHYLLIGVGIVMFWRGIWELLDLFLLPNNHAISAVICIGLALIIFFVDDGELDELDL